MEIIALDLGSARTGIARASTLARLAEPLTTVPTSQLSSKLKNIIAQHPVKAVVIGLPRSADGADNQQSKWVRQWAESIKKQVGVPVYFQDEYLTTELAAAQPKKTNVAGGTDAVAATIILQDFLTTPETDRVLV